VADQVHRLTDLDEPVDQSLSVVSSSRETRPVPTPRAGRAPPRLLGPARPAEGPRSQSVSGLPCTSTTGRMALTLIPGSDQPCARPRGLGSAREVSTGPPYMAKPPRTTRETRQVGPVQTEAVTAEPTRAVTISDCGRNPGTVLTRRSWNNTTTKRASKCCYAQ
jgi:hypothetical protein